MASGSSPPSRKDWRVSSCQVDISFSAVGGRRCVWWRLRWKKQRAPPVRAGDWQRRPLVLRWRQTANLEAFIWFPFGKKRITRDDRGSVEGSNPTSDAMEPRLTWGTRSCAPVFVLIMERAQRKASGLGRGVGVVKRRKAARVCGPSFYLTLYVHYRRLVKTQMALLNIYFFGRKLLGELRKIFFGVSEG